MHYRLTGPDSERKTVIVGQSKPLLNYVTACITMFNGGARQVVGVAGASVCRC
jgi:DNA-binding protein